MSQRKKAFTLIELIIVVVIIGILALVAIPRYFANVAKAQKSQVVANMDAMRQALLSYYTVYGVYPADQAWPVKVILDGDTIVNMSNPDSSSANWYYYWGPSSTACPPSLAIVASKQPGGTCFYYMCVDSSSLAASTCTP